MRRLFKWYKKQQQRELVKDTRTPDRIDAEARGSIAHLLDVNSVQYAHVEREHVREYPDSNNYIPTDRLAVLLILKARGGYKKIGEALGLSENLKVTGRVGLEPQYHLVQPRCKHEGDEHDWDGVERCRKCGALREHRVPIAQACYLIEVIGRPAWWRGEKGISYFTPDATLAIRFSRREDAESALHALRVLSPGTAKDAHVTEHVWL